MSNTITNIKKYYIYKAEPKATSCDRCLNNDRRIFEEDEVPLIPVHPNCRCNSEELKEVKINNTYIDTIEYREYYANENKLLPGNRGRYYMRVYTNNTNTWLVYSNDGLIFYTFDNGKTFYLASVADDFLYLLNEIELIYPSKDYESKYNEVIDKIPAELYESDLSINEKVLLIIDQINGLQVDEIKKWSFWDALNHGKNKIIHNNISIKQNYCTEWIIAYKEVIKTAAEICDIPPELLAGVAWIEVGGMFTFIDHIAYSVRKDKINQNIIDRWNYLNLPTITKKNPDMTSFGSLSMQLKRIAEVLRIDINDLSESDKYLLIGISEIAPIQIFLAAQHLSDLKNVDFPEISSTELTIDEIKVIASRYNIGPDHDYKIALTNEYGNRIIDMMGKLTELLK